MDSTISFWDINLKTLPRNISKPISLKNDNYNNKYSFFIDYIMPLQNIKPSSVYKVSSEAVAKIQIVGNRFMVSMMAGAMTTSKMCTPYEYFG